MTFTIGSWAIPVFISFLAAIWFAWPRESEKPTGGMFDFGPLLGWLFRAPIALSAALGSWLVWSLLRGGA